MFIPHIVSEKDMIWEDNQTKEVYEHFNADKNLSSLDLIVLSESKLNSKCTNAMLENYIDN